MEKNLKELEQIFQNRATMQKERLISLFNEAGLPEEICWRNIYSRIFDIDGSTLNSNLSKSQLEPLMEKSLKLKQEI